MSPENLDTLNEFRERALAEGISPDDIARWVATARPCAFLGTRGDGPVVGRLGGPLMLPADAPDPWCKLAATIDLAALPSGVTDLDLPADGHLLLFADPDPDRIGKETWAVHSTFPPAHPSRNALWTSTRNGRTTPTKRISRKGCSA
ncbi:hypothetical protein SGRIM128S_02582 [Streptomyces griseomycini]